MDRSIPEGEEAKILKSAEEYNKKQKSDERRKPLLRYSKTVTIVMLIISVAFSTIVISVDAFR